MLRTALLFLALTIAALAGPAGAMTFTRDPGSASGASVANQATAVTGSVANAYVFDGNFRRAKATRAVATVYDAYSRVTGSILYRHNITYDFKFDFQAIGPMAVTFNKGVADRFYHSDAQGSRLAFSNAAGAVASRSRYAPFGEMILMGPGSENFIAYTGHMRDQDTGLTYMQARFHDPILGRFLSTDPIGYQDQLNLYAYVANDPVNMVDPNGEFGVAGFIYGAISGGVGGYIASGGNIKSVLVGAAVGGAVGAVNPFASSVAGAAAGSAVASVAGQVAGGVVNGQSVGEAAANVDKAAVVGAGVGGGAGRAVGAIVGNATAPIRGSVIGSEVGRQTVSRAPGDFVGSIIEGSAAGAGELAGPPVAEAAHQAGTAFFEAVDNAVATEMEHNQQRFDDDLDR